MNKTGFFKYKILRLNKPIIADNYFCEKIRTGKQNKLIKKLRQTGQDISSMKLNWDYISQRDNLEIRFIEEFKDYIKFDKLSENKYLTIKHIRVFKNNLNWNILSRFYKFKLQHLLEFQHKVNWEYIYFYQNLTSANIQKHFRYQMWWLFSDDEIKNDLDTDYKRVNDMIIHKNIRTVSTQFAKRYHKKLTEYQRNREELKETLKGELIDLIDEYQNDGTIKRMMSIQINLIDKRKLKNTVEKETQVEIMKEQEPFIVELINPFEVPLFTIDNFGENSNEYLFEDFAHNIMISNISSKIIGFLDTMDADVLNVLDEKLNKYY